MEDCTNKTGLIPFIPGVFLLTWEDVLEFSGDYEDEFVSITPGNPVSYYRATVDQGRFRDTYKEVRKEMCDNENDGNIIIENLGVKDEIPVIFILDEVGRKVWFTELDKQQIFRRNLMVTGNVMPNLELVTAALMMYLEYPIRMRRLLKERQDKLGDIEDAW